MALSSPRRFSRNHPRLFRFLLSTAVAWTVLLAAIIIWGVYLHRVALPDDQPLPWTFFQNLIGAVGLVWGVGLAGLTIMGRMVGRHLDVRHKFQRELSEANRLLREEREVFLGGAVVVFRWRNEPDGPVEYVSPNVRGLLGYSSEDFTTRRVLYEHIIHPGDVRRVVAEVRAAEESGTRHLEHQPYRLLARDGGTVWVMDYTTVQRDPTGRVSGYIGYVVDISTWKKAEQDLRRSEERLALVLESAELGMWDWNVPSGKVLFNEQWASMLGYELAEITQDLSTWEELVHPDDKDRVLKQLQDHLDNRAPRYASEQRLRTKQGGWKWVLDTGKVIERDAEGHPLRAVGIHQDISDRKYMQQNLVRQERLAAVGQLAAGVAHDFNNLLTSVLGFSELVLESPQLDEVVRGQVERIKVASLRGAKLVRQIMDFSQKTLRHPQPVELCDFLAGHLDFFRSLLPENIELKLDCGGEPQVVEADPTQLQQVVTNLATNAMLAMPGGGSLTIELSRVELEAELTCTVCNEGLIGTWVLLEVADTGVGMAEEIQPRVFEPFFTTRDVGQGSGLGLSQTAGIVGQNKGHILLESQLGQGTIVRIYLPPSSAEQVKPVQGGAVVRGAGQTVLLVEDQDDVREATGLLLERLGYRVTALASSRPALELFLKDPNAFDLVLTDMVMPDMSGLVMLNEMRRAAPRLRAIIMTGYPEMEISKQVDLEEVRGDASVIWLAKPVGLEELSRSMAETLGD